jgi:hypothetical protein
MDQWLINFEVFIYCLIFKYEVGHMQVKLKQQQCALQLHHLQCSSNEHSKKEGHET